MIARIFVDKNQRFFTPKLWMDISPSKSGILKKDSLKVLMYGVDSFYKFSYEISLDRLASIIFKFGGFDFGMQDLYDVQDRLWEGYLDYVSPIHRGEKNAYIVGLLNALRFDGNFLRKVKKVFDINNDDLNSHKYFSSNMVIDDTVQFSEKVNKFVKGLGIMQ